MSTGRMSDVGRHPVLLTVLVLAGLSLLCTVIGAQQEIGRAHV